MNKLDGAYRIGQGRVEKSTGPPRPASASRIDMMRAIAVSSLALLLLFVSEEDDGPLLSGCRTCW